MSEEWQKIETAPKNGEFVDLWMVDSESGLEYRITDCVWKNEEWTCYDREGDEVLASDYSFINPTHWRYPPNPPVESFN